MRPQPVLLFLRHQSRHILDEFAEKVADIANVDKAPKVEGRSLVMFLSQKR